MSRLTNDSEYPTSLVREILETASETCMHAFMTRVRVVTRETPSPAGISGIAVNESAGDAAEPCTVTITLPKREACYPCRSRHEIVTEVGWVGFRDFEEELLFVLAHEMRHIDQFYRDDLPNRRDDVYTSELDAELHALRTLYLFQKRRATDRAARAG